MNDQVILVRLCDTNSLGFGEILNNLRQSSGRVVMAESPSYYQSLSPVLSTIRTTMMDNYQLLDNIVFGNKSSEPPNYIQRFRSDRRSGPTFLFEYDSCIHIHRKTSIPKCYM